MQMMNVPSGLPGRGMGTMSGWSGVMAGLALSGVLRPSDARSFEQSSVAIDSTYSRVEEALSCHLQPSSTQSTLLVM